MRTATLCLSLLLLACASRRADPPVGTIVRAGDTSGSAAAEAPAGIGAPCPDGRCAEGLTCLRYYGAAGPAGPQLSACEIPCPEGKCPQGKSCITIADGPGAVCR